MNKLYLVLADSDFGRSLSLSRATDLMTSESEADATATDAINDGDKRAYLFELKRVYEPRPTNGTKQVEVVYVD